MKKMMQLLGVFTLFAFVLAGCGNDNEPPQNDNPVNEEKQDIQEDINEEMNDEKNDVTEDKNEPGDGDIMKDENTPIEDPAEDLNDMQDPDKKDE